VSAAMSANDDTNPMSPYGDTVNSAGMDVPIVRARCCRDWPVLAMTRMGRCGYCGQVPVVVQVEMCVCGHRATWHSPGCIGCGCAAMSEREGR